MGSVNEAPFSKRRRSTSVPAPAPNAPCPYAPGRMAAAAAPSDRKPPTWTRRPNGSLAANDSARLAIAETVLDVIAAAAWESTSAFTRPARSLGSSVDAVAMFEGTPVPAKLIAETR